MKLGFAKPKTKCSIDGCERNALARGWCSPHYHSWNRRGDPLVSKRRFSTMEERFWAKVQLGSSEECWIWQAALKRDGYGLFRVESYVAMRSAHRVSWEIAFGEIPTGMQVLHRCDNPPCVNPSHLWLGTQQDNIRDMNEKGRHVKAYQKRRAA